MEGHRAERVTEAIREELAELISYEMSDPRVSSATVTEVHVSPDLKRRARVSLAFPHREEADPALKALEKAKGFLKRELSRRLDLYRVPDLHFEADIGTVIGDRMDFLFRRIRKGRPRDAEKNSG
jgi:ribosome-binding factor A